MSGLAGQLSLLGREPIGFDASFSKLERITLTEGAWLEVARGWLRGDAELFEHVLAVVPWRTEQRRMYDRTVEVPRQYAVLDEPGAIHPVIDRMRVALDARYATRFERVSVALYRDGRHSVAWHGDYVARRLPEAHVVTVSVGAPRRFLVRKTGGGASIGFNLGWGDLMVMGGSAQRTHQHAIPKVARADPRIVIMFRPRWQGDDPDAPPAGEQEPSPPSAT